MVLYDFLAPAYDLAFEKIYRPFRARALEAFPLSAGATVLDLACGTGQNFPLVAERVGGQGRIIGVDISSGMLKRARRRVVPSKISLINLDAAALSSTRLEEQTRISSVDFILCTYGLTSMRDWKAAFHASWELLKPGGGYLIHDIAAEQRTLHVCAVETITRSNFCEQVWRPLQESSSDFRMDYLDPSAHLFGGRLFVAHGTKPFTSSPCPS